MELNLKKYCTGLKDNYLVQLNALNKFGIIPPKNIKRNSNIFLRRDFIEIDTITYRIPEGFIVSQIPEENNIESVFGNYKTTITNVDNKLIYVRKFNMTKGNYPSEKYEEFVSFFERIKKADNAKFVISKHELSAIKNN